MIYLALALIALNLADILLTATVLQLGGVEGNPVVRYLLAEVGVVGAAVIKMFVVGMAAYLFVKLKQRFWLIASVVGMGGVVLWNIWILVLLTR